MDIRQLDYFVAVAQLRSFTRASDELFLSRQALSKAVRNLEHEIGNQLLVNEDGHLKLTEAGSRFLEDALPIVHAYKDLKARYTDVPGVIPATRELSVAMAHGVSLSMPDRAIDTFRAMHANMMLSVEEVTTETALEMARLGESDISLVGSAPQYLQGFDIALVVGTGMYVFVPTNNPLANRSVLKLQDLDGQPFMTFGKRNHLHQHFMQACRRQNVHPNILLTTSDLKLLVRSADEQQALYFGFPPTIVNSKRENRVLVPVDTGFEDDFGTYAIKRKGATLSSSARLFWNYLKGL